MSRTGGLEVSHLDVTTAHLVWSSVLAQSNRSVLLLTVKTLCTALLDFDTRPLAPVISRAAVHHSLVSVWVYIWFFKFLHVSHGERENSICPYRLLSLVFFFGMTLYSVYFCSNYCQSKGALLYF